MKKKLLLFKTFLLCLLITLYSCSTTPKSDDLYDFIGNEFEITKQQLNEKEPIVSLLAIAKKEADKTIQISKENIKSALQDAEFYRSAFIIVGKHTIVKITNLKDCQKSTSWSALMPYGKALIQKDGFSSKSDYINNLIGKPDKQIRWLLLFN